MYRAESTLGRRLAAAITLVAAAHTVSSAQCPHWETGPVGPLSASLTSVDASAVMGPWYVAGGEFTFDIPDGSDAYNLAVWDGLTVTSLGGGANGPVRALLVFSPLPGMTSLVAGGNFTTVGTGSAAVSASRIAVWTVNQDAGGLASWAALGPGLNGTVYAIERYNGVIYAAGDFTMSGQATVNRIARYNSTLHTWEPASSGMNGTVRALKAYGGRLYAGGSFTTAGGASTGGLARFDGTTWSAVTGVFAGNVYAMETYTPSALTYLLIGGSWNGAVGGATPPSPNLSVYNGTGYVDLAAPGGTNGPVYTLHADGTGSGTRVYAGGSFSLITGRGCGNTAVFSGAGWDPLQSGTDGGVQTMRVFHGEVLTGGLFESAGGVARPRIARFQTTGTPWIARQPPSMTACRSGVHIECLAASRYEVTYRWRHDGVPLVDGTTATGEQVVGSATEALEISDLTNLDEGTYDCVVTGPCSAVATQPATLTVCMADWTCNGAVEPSDVSAYISRWFQDVQFGGTYSDMDGNGLVEPADVSRFVSVWFDEVVNGC